MCGLCPHMYAWASCIEPFKCMQSIHLPSVCSQETKRPEASWSLGNMHLYAKLHLQAKLASACCACAWHASVVGAPLTRGLCPLLWGVPTPLRRGQSPLLCPLRVSNTGPTCQRALPSSCLGRAQACMCGQSPHIESQHLENWLKGLALPNTKAYFALLGALPHLHAKHMPSVCSQEAIGL